MRPSFRRFAFQLIYFWITFWTSCGLNVLGIPVPRAMIRYFAMVGLLFVSKTNGGLGNRQVGVTTGPPHPARSPGGRGARYASSGQTTMPVPERHARAGM